MSDSRKDPITAQAQRDPERLALVDLTSGKRWSYGALDDAAARWSSLLRADYGVRRGDRVVCIAKNRAESVLLHFACSRVGAIYTPLNWRLCSSEIATLIDDAEPCLIAGDVEMTRLGVAGVSLERLSSEAHSTQPFGGISAESDEPCLMLFTSGTSGRPKGALLSPRNLVHAALSFSVLGEVTRDSVFLIDAPLFHIIGLVTSLYAPLMQGGVALISDGFDPSRTLSRLADPTRGVTHYFCVPQMAQRLRASPEFDAERLCGLRAVFTGGAPLGAADTMPWLDAGVLVVNGYGMTEAGTIFGMPLDPQMIAGKCGAVGIAAPGIAARVVDEVGAECLVGVAGELILKGESVFSGYWRRPEEMTKAFTDDGWFQTGDIALCDTDGYFWILDRKKDMYISGGENVYPAEIECALTECPGVKESGVFGVPDAQWGEVGHLAIVFEDGAECSVQNVLEFLRPRLARYKMPKHVSVVESLPRTASGKIQKNILRDQLIMGVARALQG